jgi:hypothetical protein
LLFTLLSSKANHKRANHKGANHKRANHKGTTHKRANDKGNITLIKAPSLCHCPAAFDCR